MIKKVLLPDNVKGRIESEVLILNGPKGELRRSFSNPLFNLSINGNELVIKSVKESESRKFKKVINTYESHLKNMIKGVIDGYEAHLKITYSHFPMTVKIEGNKVIIENFIGEKKNRVTKILEGTKVSINGNEVIVTGIDKEAVGQTAANLEHITQIKYRDRRVFQDGIWITKKP